jgi:hypothetical protein
MEALTLRGRQGCRCNHCSPPTAERWSLPMANSKAKIRQGWRVLAKNIKKVQKYLYGIEFPVLQWEKSF